MNEPMNSYEYETDVYKEKEIPDLKSWSELAIELAIEKGGYLDFNGTVTLKALPTGLVNVKEDRAGVGGFHTTQNISKEKAILDPLFWQALGKALGWERIMGFDEMFSPAQDEAFEWYHNAMKYYHLLLTGENTEDFWKELLNK